MNTEIEYSQSELKPIERIDVHEEHIEISAQPGSSDAIDVDIHSQEFVHFDPELWTFPITDSQRRDLFQIGPQNQLKMDDDKYPKDKDHRHFSNFHYSRKLNNGEIEHRRWLVYSDFQNKVFCFPCRLFGHSQTKMVQQGCSDWKHLSNVLNRHENTKEHMAFMFK